MDRPCRNPSPPSGQPAGEVTCAEWSQGADGHHHYCDGPKDHRGELHTCRCGHRFTTPVSRDDDIGKCPLVLGGMLIALAGATVLIWSALTGGWL